MLKTRTGVANLNTPSLDPMDGHGVTRSDLLHFTGIIFVMPEVTSTVIVRCTQHSYLKLQTHLKLISIRLSTNRRHRLNSRDRTQLNAQCSMSCHGQCRLFSSQIIHFNSLEIHAKYDDSCVILVCISVPPWCHRGAMVPPWCHTVPGRRQLNTRISSGATRLTIEAVLLRVLGTLGYCVRRLSKSSWSGMACCLDNAHVVMYSMRTRRRISMMSSANSRIKREWQ